MSIKCNTFEGMRDTYTSETNLITEEVEALDALLGVTNILELGKAETRLALAVSGIQQCERHRYLTPYRHQCCCQ